MDQCDTLPEPKAIFCLLTVNRLNLLKAAADLLWRSVVAWISGLVWTIPEFKLEVLENWFNTTRYSEASHSNKLSIFENNWLLLIFQSFFLTNVPTIWQLWNFFKHTKTSYQYVNMKNDLTQYKRISHKASKPFSSQISAHCGSTYPELRFSDLLC